MHVWALGNCMPGVYLTVVQSCIPSLFRTVFESGFWLWFETLRDPALLQWIFPSSGIFEKFFVTQKVNFICVLVTGVYILENPPPPPLMLLHGLGHPVSF
jgi:hypothetical protein